MSFAQKFRLDGKVAIITGVGPTNGQSFAKALAEAGAKLCLVARSANVTGPLVEEIVGAGGAAISLQADLTDPGSAPRIVEKCGNAFGRVDILFSHSGGVGPLADIYDVDDGDWDKVLRMNLHSAFYLTKAASKAMISGGRGGSIVYTSSTASVMTPPRLTSYSVAKAAVSQLARCTAVELAPHGIRVNAIMLGTFENAGPGIGRIAEGYREWWLKETPLARFGNADEAGAAALFLASDASSYVTGTILRVTGGIALFG